MKRIRGEVVDRTPPTTDCAEGEALTCCATPAKGAATIEIDL